MADWIGRFGIKRKLVRWIFGNPVGAITMLRHDLSAGLFVPVELLLMEQVDGQGSVVIYVRPSSLIATGKNSDLRAAAKALDLQGRGPRGRTTKSKRNRKSDRLSAAKGRSEATAASTQPDGLSASRRRTIILPKFLPSVSPINAEGLRRGRHRNPPYI